MAIRLANKFFIALSLVLASSVAAAGTVAVNASYGPGHITSDGLGPYVSGTESMKLILDTSKKFFAEYNYTPHPRKHLVNLNDVVVGSGAVPRGEFLVGAFVRIEEVADLAVGETRLVDGRIQLFTDTGNWWLYYGNYAGTSKITATRTSATTWTLSVPVDGAAALYVPSGRNKYAYAGLYYASFSIELTLQ